MALIENGKKYNMVEILGLVGNDKQKASYQKCGVIRDNIKKALLLEIGQYGELKEVPEGKFKLYEVIEVFDTPRPKVDGRAKGNNGVYADDLDFVVMSMLNESRDNTVNLSITKALEETSIVNPNYRVARREIPSSAIVLQTQEKYIYTFFDDQQRRFKEIFEGCLKRLRRKALIMWNMTTMVVIYEKELNEVGGVKKDGEWTKIYREANEKEREYILKSEREVLKEMGMNDKQTVFLCHKWKEFSNKVNKRLNEVNIEYSYEAYHITLNQEGIREVVREEIKKRSLNLNENIVTRSKKLISDKHYKNVPAFGKKT